MIVKNYRESYGTVFELTSFNLDFTKMTKYGSSKKAKLKMWALCRQRTGPGALKLALNGIICVGTARESLWVAVYAIFGAIQQPRWAVRFFKNDRKPVLEKKLN